MSGNGWHGHQADDPQRCTGAYDCPVAVHIDGCFNQPVSQQKQRPLRLVGKPDNNRPTALAVSREPGYPVTLALGDWCQLLNMAANTPMHSKLEGTRVEVTLGLPEVAAACTMLQADGTPWARMTQEAIAHRSHPSFMPPVDDAPPHGYPRPVVS